MKNEKLVIVEAETPERELIKEICWGIAVLCHFLIIFHLYFGENVQSDNDPLTWDMSQLVAISAIWVYIGVFSFLSCYSCDTFQRSIHLSSTFNLLAMVLPITSCIFSLVGIVMVFFQSAVGCCRERIFLAILYGLNIVFITTFAQALGLFESMPVKVRQFDESTEEESESRSHHHHDHHPFSHKRKKTRDAWETLTQAFPG